MEVEEELDAVVAVYGDDVVGIERIGDGGARVVTIRINPDVAGHEALIHASLLVRISIPDTYPAAGRAEVVIESMAGVADEDGVGLDESLAAKSKELEGEQSLFELLQACKDFANDHNVPADDCCICMCPFDDDEPYVKAKCSHSFHSECLSRWIHDQRVQAHDKSTEKAHKDGDREAESGGGAKCAVCRQDIGEDRVKVLEEWLVPLWAEYERDKREREERERLEREVADEGERLRRKKEREQRERKEMSEFRPLPLIVMPDYRHNNLKLLRHAVLPLGATDSRIIRLINPRMEGKATFVAAVWFPCMDKAEKAVRGLSRESARLATWRDTKVMPPDFMRGL